VPIHRRPLLDYWLDLLCGASIERVLVNTHWLADKVEGHIASSKWRDRIDLVHERELLGTGGTMLANRHYFAGQPFLAAHADNLTDFDVERLVAAHQSRPAHCVMTMLAFRSDDPRSCGILELDAQGRVVGFHEKVENPPGNLANAAVYVIEPQMIEFIASLEKSGVDFSTEVIPLFIGRIAAIETPGYHRDIGNLRSLERAEKEFPLSASCSDQITPIADIKVSRCP
jgi:mannose-1-phosphate guanylyltransferase